jgi:hypothetical protein
MGRAEHCDSGRNAAPIAAADRPVGVINRSSCAVASQRGFCSTKRTSAGAGLVVTAQDANAAEIRAETLTGSCPADQRQNASASGARSAATVRGGRRTLRG